MKLTISLLSTAAYAQESAIPVLNPNADDLDAHMEEIDAHYDRLEDEEAMHAEERSAALKEHASDRWGSLKQLIDRFSSMDTNADGFLSKEEAHAMSSNEEEIESIDAFISKADGDADGKITLEEYTSFAEKLDEERFDEKMRTIDSEFAAADTDQSGAISYVEVHTLVGEEVPEEDVKAFFTDADVDANGEISYDEYVDYAFQTDDEMEQEAEL